MKLYVTQCHSCRHAKVVDGRFIGCCDAFPDGIPPQIHRGEHDHREPYKDDQGIRWEPVELNTPHPFDEDQDQG